MVPALRIPTAAARTVPVDGIPKPTVLQRKVQRRRIYINTFIFVWNFLDRAVTGSQESLELSTVKVAGG